MRANEILKKKKNLQMLQYCNIKDEGLETIKSLFRETSSSVITLIVKPSGDKQRFVSFHILSNLCRCIAGEWLSLFVSILISIQKPLWISISHGSYLQDHELRLLLSKILLNKIHPTSRKWLPVCETCRKYQWVHVESSAVAHFSYLISYRWHNEITRCTNTPSRKPPTPHRQPE